MSEPYASVPASGPPPPPPAPRPRRTHSILGRLAEAVREQNWFAVAIEVLVVIVGVVVGFQVTSWGQARAARQTETQSLREVRDALARDLPDIRWNAGFHERSRDSARLLREHLRERRPYSDTLDAHFGHVLGSTYSVRDETAYETLKQRGLDTVTDDSLRVAIGRVYGVAYAGLIPNQAWLDAYVHDAEVPFYDAHFQDSRFGRTATPVDYDALLDATTYAAILDWRIQMDALLADQARELEAKVTALVARLDAELARR